MYLQLATAVVVLWGILGILGLYVGVRRNKQLLMIFSIFLLFAFASGLGAIIGSHNVDSYTAKLKVEVQTRTGGEDVKVTTSDSVVWDVKVDGRSMFYICKKVVKEGEDPCVLATILTQK